MACAVNAAAGIPPVPAALFRTGAVSQTSISGWRLFHQGQVRPLAPRQVHALPAVRRGPEFKAFLAETPLQRVAVDVVISDQRNPVHMF